MIMNINLSLEGLTRIHNKKCLSVAMLCAVENFRDNPEMTSSQMLTTSVSDEALGYLRDELCNCICTYYGTSARYYFSSEDVIICHLPYGNEEFGYAPNSVFITSRSLNSSM